MKDMFLDLAKYRIQRAFENKADAELLLKNERLSESVNRIYLANFYGVKSLLATKMKDFNKHQKVLNIFQESFILTGEVPREYGQIVDRSYRSRDDSERHEQMQLTRQQAVTLVEESGKFLCFVREYLKQIILSNPRKGGEVPESLEECAELNRNGVQ
ncbi:MAG: hypothetical protein A3F83_03225 [Candidatus Glassbacteria bacterium RIFCSPLOWO2_12_FULL_58_11]|uniref:HEPN domain-containing protein n=2 Tax=Candidatus Glassiibacteriota TaxID=1817805 RepID=A0A1F5YYB7_9BACT|nr:MAG: hypothetical protein A2Z86_06130 [Candidatus Glassbacteria bacterium GWA2_58_10]OGG05190.1 MAG: hypothetical protein A3F83_03225 [Candidatus Glassbacteria bacterium RIFCSPLOWO2_12_FULL_58_11]